MGLDLIAAPTVEPLTVDEVKAHLRIDHCHEDMLLASLIASSRLHIEAALDLALISQSWSWTLDAWPDSHVLELPLRPVHSVEAIRVAAENGTKVQLSPDRFLVDGAIFSSRIISTSGGWPQPSVPALGIEVAFTAGFGGEPSDVPQPIRQALLMLVAHWYEHREPVAIGTDAARIPDTVSALLMPYRRVRL